MKKRSAVRLLPVVAGAAGLALAVWLLDEYGVGQILDLVARAGWFGVSAVILFHLVQVLFSALAWRTIAGPAAQAPGLLSYCGLRWIREGVNNLLPVAQIGGEFVAARLMRRRGLPLTAGIAGTLADLTMEMVTQIAFTLLGLLLLLHSVGGGQVAGYVGGFLLTACLVAAGFLGAQWLGLAGAVERGLLWLGGKMGWSGMGEVEGLHRALLGCYRSPGRVLGAMASHSVSWLLGGVEICIALHFLGHDVGLVAGTVIESRGQALKAAGFAVPGALGVQEGGLIVICQAYGLTPEVAIALSLVKRLREVVLGVPGLLAWQRAEAGRTALSAEAP